MANDAPLPETIHVKTRYLHCDGGQGALGHPRVYLTMGEDKQVECGYCDRLFILDEGDALAKGGVEAA